MYKEAIRPAWVEVNLNNFDYNIKQIKAKAAGRELIGVIKADAYGHGAVPCARIMLSSGADMLAVATVGEGTAKAIRCAWGDSVRILYPSGSAHRSR